MLLCITMLLACVDCGMSDVEESEAPDSAVTHSGEQGADNNSQRLSRADSGGVRGLTMTVNRDTGELSVRRMALPSRSEMGESDKWTIFIIQYSS